MGTGEKGQEDFLSGPDLDEVPLKHSLVCNDELFEKELRTIVDETARDSR